MPRGSGSRRSSPRAGRRGVVGDGERDEVCGVADGLSRGGGRGAPACRRRDLGPQPHADRSGHGGAEDQETPQVKLGDASMAAPFTSRVPSVRPPSTSSARGDARSSARSRCSRSWSSRASSARTRSASCTDGIRSSDNQMMASGFALPGLPGVLVPHPGAHAEPRAPAAVHLPPGELCRSSASS